MTANAKVSVRVDPVRVAEARRGSVIRHLHSVVAAPVTSAVRGIPSEVALTREDGLLHPSVANFDHLQHIGRDRLIRRVGTLSEAKLSETCRALRFALAC